MTKESHLNNLDTILDKKVCGKPAIFLCKDGGSDWNTKSWIAQLFLQCLFKRRNRDTFDAMTYAPAFSAFYMIEHLRSLLPSKLSVLPMPQTGIP